MPHAFADDGQRDVHGVGNACPRVSGTVEGEFARQLKPTSNVVQHAVHHTLTLTVLASLTAVTTLDDGQQVIGIGRWVAVNDFLYLRLHAHGQLLPGLVSAVGQYATLDVSWSQVGNVNERHASGVEGKQEDVTCKGLCRRQPVHIVDTLDDVERDGPFAGFPDAGIYPGKGFPVDDKPFCHGAVVDGAQHAQIERGAVAGNTPGTQVTFVVTHERPVNVA